MKIPIVYHHGNIDEKLLQFDSCLATLIYCGGGGGYG